MIRATVPVAMLLGLSPFGLFAQDPVQEPETVEIVIRIVDSSEGRPLLGAIVQLSGMAERWVTNVDGQVEVRVPVGEYVLTAERSGYERLVGDFEVFRAGGLTLRLSAVDLEDPWAPGRLLGTVVDNATGRPLEGVSISLLPRRQTVTDERGRFVYNDLNPGLTRITVERLGYAERNEPISVQPGRTTAVEVRMAIEPIELPPIRVEVRSRHLELAGVYDRMDRGTSGQYVTREEIEARVSPDLSDSFFNVPGVQVERFGQYSVLLGRGRCQMQVFMDGVQVGLQPSPMGGQLIVNIDDFPPDWVELVEVYAGPAAVPAEFTRPDNDCGVVLIWTRRGGQQ